VIVGGVANEMVIISDYVRREGEIIPNMLWVRYDSRLRGAWHFSWFEHWRVTTQKTR
jgi:hypothetical protein